MNYLEAFGFAHLILYTCIGVCKVYGKYIAELRRPTLSQPAKQMFHTMMGQK